jgi:hypothetical protein
MKQFETTAGSRKVVSFSNDGRWFVSRLYVNKGETATLTSRVHRSEK